MLDFSISNKEVELIKNEEELKKDLADYLGEFPNAKIINELSDAAKYYTNNGTSNIVRYSFRANDICFITLLTSFFSYAFRSMWTMAGILFAIFFIVCKVSKVVFFGYFYPNTAAYFFICFLIYFLVAFLSSIFYRYYLIKDFLTKYELVKISGFRNKKPINIAIAIGVVVVAFGIYAIIHQIAYSMAVKSAIDANNLFGGLNSMGSQFRNQWGLK